MPGGVKTDVRTYQMYVNGEWIDSKSNKTFPVYDPATEEVIAQVPDANADDVNRAVAAAKAAFEDGPWGSTTAQERGRVLFRLAEKIRQNTAMLAELESRNTGKPIVEAEYDIADVATCFEYYGGLATKILGFVNPVPDNAVSLTLKEPIGVAGQIIPWNYPLLMAAWKLAPALAAGCTCVLKPAEQTPITALEMANWLADVGLPPGVVNIITGFGETCGAPLVQHPDVNKIAFTGSAAVGKIIVKQAADTVKRVTLELGGKSPNIFFADVMDKDDEFFDKALEGFALFAFNKGEVCTCPSRALVQESIFDKFVEKAVARVAKIKVGNPLDPTTMMGAQASHDQLEKILGYIDVGKKEGAKCMTGGKQAHIGADFEKGYYVEPTVFTGHNKMRIFQEEIFGPVLSVTKFKTLEEAIEIGNDTVYGLGAGVWSRNGTNCYRVGREIKAGRVWTNCYHLYPAGAAFGGYKQSGYGRETHKIILEHYQQTKNLLVSYSPKALGFF
jgi:aldehyde dehydrogenase